MSEGGVNHHHPRLRLEAAGEFSSGRAGGVQVDRADSNYLASALLVPGGEALWLASSSCSVIGRVMGHGLLVEVNVTGGQELVEVAANVVARLAFACDTV